MFLEISYDVQALEIGSEVAEVSVDQNALAQALDEVWRDPCFDQIKAKVGLFIAPIEWISIDITRTEGASRIAERAEFHVQMSDLI